MAFWKPSVASWTAFFERASRQEDLGTGNEKDVVKPSTLRAVTGNETSSPETNNAAAFESMVHDVWGDLLHHARESQYTGMDQVCSAAVDDLVKKRLTNVAEEVCRRELIAVLETVSSHIAKSGRDGCVISEEQTVVNSLKRRLKEMSKEAKNAKVALHFANKEKFELERVCEEHEENRKKLSCLCKDVEARSNELRSVNTSLMNAVNEKDDQIQKLQAEMKAVDVERVQALHKAEMAELVAEQAELHSRRVSQQLKDAQDSSRLVDKQIRGLKRALQQMTAVVANAFNSSERPKSHWLEAQIGSLVHKSSKLFGRFRTSRSRDAKNVDGSERNEGEGNMGDTGRVENAIPENPSAPTTGKLEYLGLLLNMSLRQRDQAQPGLLRGVTSRLQRARIEQSNGAEARESRGEMGNCDRRVAFADADRDRKRPRSANLKTAGVSRVLSRGARGEPRGQLQETNPQAVEYISKALEALEKKLETLRGVYESKDEEVYRVNRELQEAIKRSNAFEQRMKSKCHKILEIEKALAATSGKSGVKMSDVLKKVVENISEREHSVRDTVTV